MTLQRKVSSVERVQVVETNRKRASEALCDLVTEHPIALLCHEELEPDLDRGLEPEQDPALRGDQLVRPREVRRVRLDAERPSQPLTAPGAREEARTRPERATGEMRGATRGATPRRLSAAGRGRSRPRADRGTGGDPPCADLGAASRRRRAVARSRTDLPAAPGCPRRRFGSRRATGAWARRRTRGGRAGRARRRDRRRSSPRRARDGPAAGRTGLAASRPRVGRRPGRREARRKPSAGGPRPRGRATGGRRASPRRATPRAGRRGASQSSHAGPSSATTRAPRRATSAASGPSPTSTSPPVTGYLGSASYVTQEV